MLVAGLMLIFKCMSAEQARSSIDWEVYVCIAFAFAVSTAMEKTKLAQAIAQLFVGLSESLQRLRGRQPPRAAPFAAAACSQLAARAHRHPAR